MTNDPILKGAVSVVKDLLEEARDDERMRCVEFIQDYFHVYDDDISLREVALAIARDLAQVEWK